MTAGPPPRWQLPAAVAAGGALGAAARYALTLAWPTPEGAVSWTILLVNVLGCVAIGALMRGLATRGDRTGLLRGFLGTGVLGGFTTFSAYALDVVALSGHGRPALAVGYLLGTVAAALAGVHVGDLAMRRLHR